MANPRVPAYAGVESLNHAPNSDGANRSSRALTVQALIALTCPLDTLLKSRSLGARLTLGRQSIVIGDKASFTEAFSAELVFKSPQTCERLCRTLRLIDFAKAFIEGDLDCNGDIWASVAVFDALRDRRQTPSEQALEILYGGLLSIPWLNAWLTRRVEHYELDATVYELFLDGYMQYTCGYFPTQDLSIDEAQIAKFHLIKDRAGIKKGSRHLDVGCGWGGLVSYFEREFGTRSLGLTNCEGQARYARERFGIDVLLADFSAMSKTAERFDLITVVGMIEHLRPRQQSNLFAILARLLENDGSIYLQCIARAPSWTGGDGSRFLGRNVFPGYFIDDPSRLRQRLEAAGLSIEQEMNHSQHYGSTAARWVERIQDNQDQICSLVGLREYRIFLGYLAMASKLFYERRGCLMRYIVTRAAQ